MLQIIPRCTIRNKGVPTLVQAVLGVAVICGVTPRMILGAGHLYSGVYRDAADQHPRPHTPSAGLVPQLIWTRRAGAPWHRLFVS